MESTAKKGRYLEGSFDSQKLVREGVGEEVHNEFYMYAEERLGKNINSAGMMWEMIEEVFARVRTVMSESGRARSGTFKLMWSSSLQEFWEVELISYLRTLTVCLNQTVQIFVRG